MADPPSGHVSRHPFLAPAVLTVVAVTIYAFLFLPILLLVVQSVNSNRYGLFPFTGVTVAWYESAFRNPQLHAAIAESLRISACVTVIATAIGTAAAFPLARAPIRFKSGVRAGLMLPIMIPGLLIGVGLLTLFTDVMRLQLSTLTVIIGQAVYVTPYVILIVTAQLQTLDPALERAAADLGAGTCRRLRHVVLPLSAQAIFASALLVLTLSVDEFVITLFLIGADNTLPIYIYTQVKFGITPEINAVATLLLLFTLAAGMVASGVPTAISAVRHRILARRQGA